MKTEWILCPVCDRKNAQEDWRRYGNQKFSSLLPEMQTGNSCKYKELYCFGL